MITTMSLPSFSGRLATWIATHTAAPDEIPQPLLDQLAENGKLVIPVGNPYSFQELILAGKKNGKITKQRITTVRFVPFQRL